MINTRSDFYLTKIDGGLECEDYKEELISDDEYSNKLRDLRDIEEASRGQY